MIGARFFAKGHEAAGPSGFGGINGTFEFMSPRGSDRHGTHTASTAADRHTFHVSMSGYAPDIAKGVAPKARIAAYKVCWRTAKGVVPKARIAAYKVCWRTSDCFESDILAAFDKAVIDDVDVISISIGGGDIVSAPYYLDSIAIGAYGAAAHSVFVSSSTGNDWSGGMSVTNIAPWMTVRETPSRGAMN